MSTEPGGGQWPDFDLDLDRVVHEPARMAILSVLSGVRSADFLFLQRALGLTKGNLSAHLAKLEESALVTIAKRFEGKTPVTSAAITPAGSSALQRHWQQLDRMRGLS